MLNGFLNTSSQVESEMLQVGGGKTVVFSVTVLGI